MAFGNFTLGFMAKVIVILGIMLHWAIWYWLLCHIGYQRVGLYGMGIVFWLVCHIGFFGLG